MLSCCTSISHKARLLSDCYPPSKQLVPPPLRPPSSSTSTSVSTHINLDESYKPLSQELSRLTYHASNKPGTLNSLGRELEVKVGKEMGKAKGGNGKSRIYILISLQILRSLILECKRDLPLFSRSALKVMESSLGLALAGGRMGGTSGGGVDLEMAVRVGACFTAFATYGTAQSLGSDDSLVKSYTSILRHFASIATHAPTTTTAPSTDEKAQADPETRNRTRLIGLAALSAAGNSDLLFAGSSDFGQQAEVIIPALLENLQHAKLSALKAESAKVNLNEEPSPYFSEFAARPAMANRRAPSLRNHVAGEKGPSANDVAGAALRTLRNLIGQCQTNQLSSAMTIFLAFVDGKSKGSGSTWADSERCCWLAETIAIFSMLQYRFVIPTALIEELVAGSQTPEASPKIMALLAMLTTLFSAEKISLVGMSTVDLLASLCNLIQRRVQFSTQDSTLPFLVEAVASLGCHSYYADQANAHIEELAAQIGQVQSLGVPRSGGEVATNAQQEVLRAETVRILVACMTNLMLSKPIKVTSEREGSFPLDENGEKVRGDNGIKLDATSRRNPISPTVWQETLPLLCAASFAVRAEYARSLLLYLKQECPAAPFLEEDGGGDGTHGINTDPLQNDLARFLNALFATLYTLAVSPQLGFAGLAKAKGKAATAEAEAVKETTEASPLAPPILCTAIDETYEAGDDTPTPLGHVRRRSLSNQPTFGRRSSKLVSLPFIRTDLDRTQSSTSNSIIRSAPGPVAEDLAGSFDYLVIKEVLSLVFTKSRPLSILLGTPMLLALEREIPHLAVDGRPSAARKSACAEVVASSWSRIAAEEAAVTSDLSNSVERLQSGTPHVICKGPVTEAKAGLFMPDTPIEFTTTSRSDHGQPNSTLSAMTAIQGLSHAPELQRGFGLSADAIAERLSIDWSVNWALRHSVEDFGPAPPSRHASYANHHAEVLMRNSNPSLNSFIQSAGRGVDLADLREALVASRNNSFTGLASVADSAASIRSGGTQGNGKGLTNGLGKKKLKPDEAREILKDIFSKKRASRSKMEPPAIIA